MAIANGIVSIIDYRASVQDPNRVIEKPQGK
jgi:hypothetical protein